MSKKLLIPLSYLLPAMVFAQSVQSLLGIINDIFNIIIPLLITLALIFFIWGVIKYVTAGGDEEGKKAGRDTMIYGIIALFVIVSVWGLVAILNSTFGIQAGGGPAGIPQGATF